MNELKVVVVLLAVVVSQAAEKDVCCTKVCPSSSSCVKITTGTATCRCNDGYAASNGTCKLGVKLFKVTKLKLQKTYNVQCGDTKSQVFIEIAIETERVLLGYLNTTNPDVIGVQVTKISEGSLLIDFNVILETSLNFTSNMSLILSSLRNGIINGNLSIIKAVNSTELAVQEPCSVKKCPSKSTCVNINRGASCRCKSGYMMDKNGGCTFGSKIFKVTKIKLLKPYLKQYANTMSKAFVETAEEIEGVLLAQLKKTSLDVKAVQVTLMSNGSLLVDFNVIVVSSTSYASDVSSISSSLALAIGILNTSSIKVDNSSSPVVEITNVCKLGSDDCMVNSDCILLYGRDFRCDCKSGYKKKKKKSVCEEKSGNKLAMSIAVPLVIVAIVIMMTVTIWWSRKSKNGSHFRCGKDRTSIYVD